jgi:hypothetical protein
LQALEGGVDPTHATILHNEHIGDRSFLRDFNEIVAELQIDTTDYGIFYAGIRDHGDDEQWVRGYHYIAPFYHMRGTVDAVFWGRRKDTTPTINGHIWVPIDDEQCWVYNFMYSHDPAQPIPPEQAIYDEARAGRGPDDLDATFVPKRNRSNDYLIDRAKQRTTSFTGIHGINTQDFVVQEGMGTINDRSREHLGSTDRCVIALRRVLLDALDRLERGEPLPGRDPATYRTRGAIRCATIWSRAFEHAAPRRRHRRSVGRRTGGVRTRSRDRRGAATRARGADRMPGDDRRGRADQRRDVAAAQHRDVPRRACERRCHRARRRVARSSSVRDRHAIGGRWTRELRLDSTRNRRCRSGRG